MVPYAPTVQQPETHQHLEQNTVTKTTISPKIWKTCKSDISKMKQFKMDCYNKNTANFTIRTLKHHILKKENILPLGKIINECMNWRFPNLYKHLPKRFRQVNPPTKTLCSFFPTNHSLHVFCCYQVLFWPNPSRHISASIWNYTNWMPIEIKMHIQHILRGAVKKFPEMWYTNLIVGHMTTLT